MADGTQVLDADVKLKLEARLSTLDRRWLFLLFSSSFTIVRRRRPAGESGVRDVLLDLPSDVAESRKIHVDVLLRGRGRRTQRRAGPSRRNKEHRARMQMLCDKQKGKGTMALTLDIVPSIAPGLLCSGRGDGRVLGAGIWEAGGS
jgi:hypothetical protein